ncbi:MAG: CsgG/HfaB family protein [Longimicrobiales bacterium]|nr:CsgG/HfaB family protein [Longimicrobiales bacterium]
MIPARPPILSVLALLFLGVAGCASMGGVTAVPSPDEIPGLESRIASDPEDLETGLRLAAAYRGAERYDEAAVLVDRLALVYEDDLGLLVMRGLIAEDIGDLGVARASYQQVLGANPGRELRTQLEQRLAVVRRAELRADVRGALAREAELAQTTPDPARVGVFPFVYEGSDPTWEPLAEALPQLLATDLGVTGRLTVVERLRVQALIDEMQLAEANRIETATAARSGRLLGSGHVVQGRLRIDDGQQVAVDAAVVEVLGPGAEGVDPVTAQDVLDRFFDLEKQLAFDLHAELGIQLTPAERERINERQTESIEALLAFGRGLRAANQGNFQQAQQSFQEAQELDPSFSMAAEEGLEVQVLASAPVTPPPDVANVTQQLAQQRAAVQQVQATNPIPSPSQVLTSASSSERSVVAEVTGQDRVGQATLLSLILRPPGNE